MFFVSSIHIDFADNSGLAALYGLFLLLLAIYFPNDWNSQVWHFFESIGKEESEAGDFFVKLIAYGLRTNLISGGLYLLHPPLLPIFLISFCITFALALLLVPTILHTSTRH